MNADTAAAGMFPESIEAIDRALFNLINGTLQDTSLDWVMRFVTNKWNFSSLIVLGVLSLLVKGGRRGRLVVVCAILLVLVADGSATTLRGLFQRERPCHAVEGARILVDCSASFSFPSSHATNVFALAAFFAIYYRRLTLPLFLFAALVGYSRVYLGVHYPMDVFAGALLGVMLGVVFGAGSRRLGHRWLEKPGSPQPDPATVEAP